MTMPQYLPVNATTTDTADAPSMDISAALASVTDTLGTVAKTVGDFMAQRDALIAQNDQASFNRYMQSAQLNLAKANIDAQNTIAQTKLQLAVQQAKNALNGNGGNIMLALTVAGVVLAFIALKRHA